MNEADRRTVLRAGGAVLAGSAIAGCLDDTDSGDNEENDGEQNETEDGSQNQTDGTEPEEPTEESLRIQNVTFLAGQPRGYRDFETVQNATYGVTDRIRVYFEPTGFGTEPASDGDVSVDLITSISITDSAGTEVYSNDDVLRQTFSEEDEDEYFAFWDVSLPPESDAGEYTVTLTVEDQIRGQTAETTATFTAEPVDELAIENVTFLDGQPRGYRDFDTVPGQTYAVTDPIHIYFEPTGFGTEEADSGDLGLDMITSLVITDSRGTEVYNNSDILRQSLTEDQVDEYFAFWGATLPPGTEPGEYNARITLEDQISGQTTETTATFTLEEAEYSSYAQQFLDTIRSELEITVTGFAERDVVNLRYTSSFEISTENARNQIGYIAGVYAGVIDQGWSTERLIGTVTDANDDRYRFEADSESAQAFMNDQITADEFAAEVLNSLEEL
ncbi:hypothetical protein [Halovenus sp. HT40]|uniref:hypothetical protein n=1 Tax=Halovenus sp. HT40 TaxID=3126691 RepID=UPI00300EC1F6